MRKTLLSSFLAFAFILGFHSVKAQPTTLVAGDIAFVGYNADAVYDDFSFILLRDIKNGTVIHFTDFGWASDVNGFQRACSPSTGALSDGALTWSANQDLPAGTQIIIYSKTVLWTSIGNIAGLQATYNFPTDYMTLATGGDQIFAFQGTLASPTLIAGIQMDGAFLPSLAQCYFTSSNSAMPPQLNSTNCLVLTTEVDNAVYNCTVTSNTPANLRAAIMNPANWTTNDATPFTLPLACTFSASTCTAAAISANPPNRTVCEAGSTTFSVTATGTGLTYQWQENSGSGFTNITNNSRYSNSTTSTLSINGVVSYMSGYAYRCVVTGTCGSATSNAGSLSISSLTSTGSQTDVSCFGGSNGSASINVSGGVGTIGYSWSVPVGTSASATSLVAGTYTVTATDLIGCQTSKTFIITQPSPITSSVTTNNASCAGASNGSATVSASGGTGSLTYSWMPGGGSNATATNLAAGNYTVTITDGIGCTKTQNLTIGVNSGTQAGGLAALPGNGATSQTQSVGTSSTYADGNCNLVTTLQPSGTNPVNGNVTTKVWVESDVPAIGGKPYVARHYEITPAINPSTSTGTVTLYFLQSEFDAFNLAAGSVLDLPANASDANGKSNLRIAKYGGTSSDNSGHPTTYSGGVVMIDPSDSDITWDATAGRWQVQFDVSGFSGFIVQTSTFTLPVTWTLFRAEKNGEKVDLKWRTGTELNNSHFVIEHSTDGTNYSSIGTLDAAGTTNNETEYNYTHHTPQQAVNFYRIQQVDIDGRHSYSEVRRINLQSENRFSIMKNPVSNGKLEIQINIDAKLEIYSLAGQVVKRQNIKAGSQAIDVSNLSKGTYIIRVGDESKKFAIQ